MNAQSWFDLAMQPPQDPRALIGSIDFQDQAGAIQTGGHVLPPPHARASAHARRSANHKISEGMSTLNNFTSFGTGMSYGAFIEPLVINGKVFIAYSVDTGRPELD